jgi:hypothetical protein
MSAATGGSGKEGPTEVFVVIGFDFPFDRMSSTTIQRKSGQLCPFVENKFWMSETFFAKL